MEVILLERVENLGQMGDVVKVRAGYARNFLLPRNKALRATKNNVAYFETQKKVLEAENLKKRAEAEKVAKKLDGAKAVLIRQASEAGHLYGSVTSRDIAEAVTEAGVKIERNQVRLDNNYKMLGLFPVKITLHPEVVATVTINIARSQDEAKLQEEKGGALVREDEKAKETPAEAQDAAPASEDNATEDEAEKADKKGDEAAA